MNDEHKIKAFTQAKKIDTTAGLSLPLLKGPYQDNGASPWYVDISTGTPKAGTYPQIFKYSLDTGSNFIWLTSILCGSTGCQHYANKQFNYNDSSSFQWRSQTEISVDFGPWGTMEVETGNDIFQLNQTVQLKSDIYLAASYTGTQFAELDWDGGIGIPSSYSQELHARSTSLIRGFKGNKSNNHESVHFDFFPKLMNQGTISPEQPYLAFNTDPKSKTGLVTMGALDMDYQDCLEYLFLPFKVYPTVTYVWTSVLNSIKVGDITLGNKVYFCLDSGSSQFKGDVTIMNEAYKLTSGDNTPLVTIELAQQDDGKLGTLMIPADIYKVKIEAGEHSGQLISQFQAMDGVDGLVLAGSVLMEHLYTVFEYEVEQDSDGYQLSARGMWIFNKTGGPKIIQNRHNQCARIFNTPDQAR